MAGFGGKVAVVGGGGKGGVAQRGGRDSAMLRLEANQACDRRRC